MCRLVHNGRVTKTTLVAIFILFLIAVPAWASNDTLFKEQWALEKIEAEKAWQAGDGGGITIAIVDSGVDGSHGDLAGNVVSGYDFVDNDSNPNDETSGPGEDCPGNPGHGTHVAGIAAAIANNEFGIAGVSPRARIMPVRVLNKYGCGTTENVRSGIAWAVKNGAHVINLSLGENVVMRNALGSEIEDAVNDAWAKGVIPVVAAGNDALFPSGYSNVNALVVGATNRSDGKAYYSNVSDAKWGLSAPGSDIVSTVPGNRFRSLSGTSMAAPHVAGAAAVMMCLGLNSEQSRDAILSNADDLGVNGPDPVYGHGRLNVGNATAGLSGCSVASSSGSSSQTGGTTSPGSASGSRGSRGSGSSGPGASQPGPAPGEGDGVESPPADAGPEGTQEDGTEATVASEAEDEQTRGVGNLIVVGILAVIVIGYFVWQWWAKRRVPSS